MADHRRIKQVSGPDSTIPAGIRPPQRAMAQYGISKIRDRQILIDASEFGWIHERGSKDDIWAEIEPCSELERTSQLVYGSFLLNPSQVTGSLDPKSLSVMQGMEMAYVHFDRRDGFYSWCSLRVIDLEILDDQPKSDHFALAAIVDVAKEATSTRGFSISAFPYNSGLTVQQNIATRSGLLAINDLDRRNQRRLQDTNWRLLVDRPRARRAAARVALSVAASG
jgi:hypothetical protein